MLTPAELVWLIAAVAKGDEAAFERLYAATRAKLFGVVLRILRRQDLAEELKRLLECVGRLEPDRQKLVLLAYYNGWSREQLAAKFEAPVNTVKTWLRRSMMDVRECLGL